MARSYGCSRVIHTSQGSSASLIIEFIYRLYISVQMSTSSLLHQPSTVTSINFASAASVSYSQYHTLFPSQAVDHVVYCYKYTISSYPLITGTYRSLLPNVPVSTAATTHPAIHELDRLVNHVFFSLVYILSPSVPMRSFHITHSRTCSYMDNPMCLGLRRF